MNAKELATFIDTHEPTIESTWLDSIGADEEQTILRALRLLAAAEANDGSTPGSDSSQVQVEVWANGERHTTSNAFIDATVARRLERERNGLAARVLVLEKIIELNVPLAARSK